MQSMVDRKSMVLVSVLLGTLMSAIDATIVILAIPTITDDLSTSLFLSIWTIILYLLVLAVLTTQLGSMSDTYGRRKLFIVGFVIFTIGSGLSGASPDILLLIIFRGLQGIGAAMIQANGGAIIADTYEAKERGRAFGFISLGWNIGGVLGIVLGGLITTFVGWRFIFSINIPIGIFGVYLGWRYIKPSERLPSKIDLRGMLYLAASLSAISYGATDIAGQGTSLFNISLIVAGFLILAPFILAERKVPNPIINLKAFSNRILTFSLIAAMSQAIGYISVVFILIMYLQGIRGLTPFQAGLLLVPGYVIASFLSPRMGHYSDIVGPRIMATLGIFLMAVGVLFYFFLGVNTTYWVVIAGSLVSGIGASMFWPANNSSVMSSAPMEIYGSISGLLRTLSNIGTLFSFVMAISVASASVPRQVAFEVFAGTSNLVGGVTTKFLGGIHSALLISILILVVAGMLSILRGSKQIKEETKKGPKVTNK